MISFFVEKSVTEDNNFSEIKPFRRQIFKWVGSKQFYAHEIAGRFGTYTGKYIEPFVGSGSIVSTLAPSFALASDTNLPLISIFRSLLRNKATIVKHYKENYLLYCLDRDHYYLVRDRYNKSGDPLDLLFLSRACYGGIVRFRKSDGHMTTPPGKHSLMSFDDLDEICDEWRARLVGTHFDLADYRESFHEAKRGNLIYCDPPYIASQGILYGSHEFKFEDLLVEIEKAKWRDVRVFLSIDSLDKHPSIKSNASGIWRIEIGTERLNRLRSRKTTKRVEYLVRF
ncbi:DNA adenine methylase Dam [Deinococcus aerius]|uniref:Site-specific DNA-methyltransferase (adenine-specific) n=1 Tax=Deinococcus aerius TaxID=200253 RepID=A0A2I9E0B2_9DEIO|nr:Dam family site-specific DNA-(adenine-N6)-methyltransferase [Deinococcus aerius]GBF06875.1 DNA adenine methylase Dam [Deinococcus aerius]